MFGTGVKALAWWPAGALVAVAFTAPNQAMAQAVPQTDYQCDYCALTGPNQQHWFFQGDEFLVTCTGWGGDNTCHGVKMSGHCIDPHYEGLCGGSDDAVADFVASRAAGTIETADGLRAYLRAHENVASINSTRHSLQITGCAGEVVVNVPLREDLVAALATEQ